MYDGRTKSGRSLDTPIDSAGGNMTDSDSVEHRIVFGTSGWRGRLGQDFNSETLQRATQGVAEYYKRNIKQGSILVGFDPRRGNLGFSKQVASILAGNSIPVRIIVEEPTPTPVLAYLANSNEKIVGVINLTASHNEYLDDGFKFSPHHGGAADKETTDQISRCANRAKECKTVSYESAIAEGLIEEIPLANALQEYVEGYILPVLKQIGAWETITEYVRSNSEFRLILDPMQGTTVKYFEHIFKQMEHETGRIFVEIIHADNHDPEFSQVNGAPNPIETDSIAELVLRVSRDKRTIGLATDGDGDRFGIVDFEGKTLSANEIIAILTYFLLEKGLSGVVEKTVATSNFVNAVAEHLNLELHETPIGFKWFVEDAVEKGRKLLIAGEEAAHVGVGPFIKSWDDGIVIGLMCLWIVAETGKSLISYKEDIENTVGKRFFYARENVELTETLKEKAEALIAEAQREQKQGLNHNEMAVIKKVKSLGYDYVVHEIITIDGLKLVFENDDWFCMRISGTENVARLYTETKNPERHESLRHVCRALLDVLPEKALSDLLHASEKQSKEQIQDQNLYKMIGFEKDDSRLGWVNPPAWEDIERVLRNFLALKVVKNKTQFIFSGMGGSINVIKALNETSIKADDIKIHTIDSLDPAAIARTLSSIDDPSKILIVGISKSGTTEETLTLLSTLKERLQTHGLDYHNHFLWLTDLPQGRPKIENSGWSGVEILPIQTDGKADIGGRFGAPHTTIFLLPLLLLLNKNLYQLKSLWSRYVQLRKNLLFRPVGKAQDLAKKTTQYFAMILEKDLSTLETWTTQLFQESLGSKMDGFNPKTFVNPRRLSDGFEPIEFQIDSSELMLRMMLNMHILELFVAVFAYHKRINFVDQPEVDIYKSKMKEVSVEDIPKTEKGTTEELIEIIRKTLQLDTAKRFLEVVCYWQLEENEKDHFNQLLRAAFPERNILVFVGSDWNHHSYQAASRNEDTLFIILTKNNYEDEVEGISNHTLQRNIRILKTIAYVTYLTLKQKSRFFELLSSNSDALLRASF